MNTEPSRAIAKARGEGAPAPDGLPGQPGMTLRRADRQLGEGWETGPPRVAVGGRGRGRTDASQGTPAPRAGAWAIRPRATRAPSIDCRSRGPVRPPT